MNTVSVGQRVYWTDPDEGFASGMGTVVTVGAEPVEEDTVIALKMDDGGEAEVTIGEIVDAKDRRLWMIDAGNSSVGPVGFVLRGIRAPSKEAALAIVRELDVLPDDLQDDFDSEVGWTHLSVYFNASALTLDDVVEDEDDDELSIADIARHGPTEITVEVEPDVVSTTATGLATTTDICPECGGSSVDETPHEDGCSRARR